MCGSAPFSRHHFFQGVIATSADEEQQYLQSCLPLSSSLLRMTRIKYKKANCDAEKSKVEPPSSGGGLQQGCWWRVFFNWVVLATTLVATNLAINAGAQVVLRKKHFRVSSEHDAHLLC